LKTSDIDQSKNGAKSLQAAFANMPHQPHEILAAAPEKLLRATSLGGMHPNSASIRLREIALIAMGEFGGDLTQALSFP